MSQQTEDKTTTTTEEVFTFEPFFDWLNLGTSDGDDDKHPQEDEEYLVCPDCGSPHCGGCK